MRQSYYAAVSYIDDQVGELLVSLNQTGLASNTIITFFGDHGWQLGERGEWAKYSTCDVATRIPLIIHLPPMLLQLEETRTRTRTGTGTRSLSLSSATGTGTDTGTGTGTPQYIDSLVELVDVFPTLIDLSLTAGGGDTTSRGSGSGSGGGGGGGGGATGGVAPAMRVPPTCPATGATAVDLCVEGSSFKQLLLPTTSTTRTATTKWKSAVFSQYPRPADAPREPEDGG
jgi:hypothetical protein